MTERRAHILFPLLVAGLTFAAFLPALRNDFVNWDDLTNFLQNRDYRGLGWPQLQWMWTSHLIGRYIPITWMTLGLDYVVWGMNPFGYHLTSILFHAVNSAVFYFVALETLKVAWARATSCRYGAMVAALLFGVHPLRVESVAWVTERRDVVSGLFYLLALLAYLRGRRYWTCFACFVLAVLSKELAVTLPLVLLILDVYPLRRRGARMWIEKLPFLAVSAATGITAYYVARVQGVTHAPTDFTWFARLGSAVYGLAFYLWKTIAPVQLSPFTAFGWHKVDPAAAPFEISLAVVLLVTMSASALRQRFPALLAGWLAYAITLSPTLGLVFTGLQITADRYSYLACLGWAILAGGGFTWWMARQPSHTPATAVAICVVLGLASLTWRQTAVWRDSDSLWTQALAVEPSAVAYTNMGTVLLERGDRLWAMENFRKAIELRPGYWLAHYDLGAALASREKWSEAEQEFQISLSLDNPSDTVPEVQNSLGWVLLKQGRFEEAIGHLHEALRLRPAHVQARANLELALAGKNYSK